MYIHGHFYNQKNDRIEVHIVTRGDRSTEVEIGGEGSSIQWTDDPVDITSQVNDTFDVLLRRQATVRLLTRNFVPDLFCASCRDAVVNIYRGGECLFAGFIEPQAYSQGYNEEQDEIELSCIDALTALQYAKYGNVGAQGVLYEAVRAGAGQRTFLGILTEILKSGSDSLDILNGKDMLLYYDGSKAVDSSAENRYRIFGQLSVSGLLFLGDGEDDVWTQGEVVEELLKYLNLHIVQDGLAFYVFSWESVKGGQDISWLDIPDGTDETTHMATVDIRTGIVTDTDTTISVGEVFNQILLSCNVRSMESVIESPLDDDLLESPYSNRQKYMTEYGCDGDGRTAYNAFRDLTHGRKTDYGGGSVTDWFVQVMDNSRWRFPGNAAGDSLTALCCQGNRNQQALPGWLAVHPGAAILSVGKVQRKTDGKDNAPVSKIDMSNYLVLSVNGNETDTESGAYPSEADIRAHIPYAVYEGNVSGGVFSPADKDTTNYIVISGKVMLNPVMRMTADYKTLHDDAEWNDGSITGKYWHQVVPWKDDGSVRYYTRQYWKAGKPSETAEWDRNATDGFIPFTEEGPKAYEYSYSAVGDGSDRISKVGVLACMLVIGDKCVVEKRPGEDLGTGVPGTGNGQTGDFVWRPYKPLDQCADEDEYYQQSFTVGFDPKIGDRLIGAKYDLQNNISYELGIDAEGTAIPVSKADGVSGRVRFMILGPVNATWDVVTRRHPTFFRRTKWSSSTVPLLAHVSSILVEEFEIKVYSDNGQVNNTGDSDIVYMSDTKETFVNRKDDIEFRISSALTAAESRKLGVTDSVKMSTPLNTETGEGVTEVYDRVRQEGGKPEQLYVDSYYREYHKPRVQMVQKLTDVDGGIVGLFAHYRHPAMDRTFFVQGINRNIGAAEAEMTLKEIERSGE